MSTQPKRVRKRHTTTTIIIAITRGLTSEYIEIEAPKNRMSPEDIAEWAVLQYFYCYGFRIKTFSSIDLGGELFVSKPKLSCFYFIDPISIENEKIIIRYGWGTYCYFKGDKVINLIK